ncbi:hypothetical protein [Jiulongibacter sediminis]|jgi:hypothetical protein|uniref:hypothetical protein n=1 Tax=Jiulongibacter sediminis TaxID=1605367 RepID=UPI0026EA1F40|nr:hypothetical protein [Jiulongibacter sediminis]
MHIQFQTNELTPAPYAHAIEIQLKEEENELNVNFEITYLGREELEPDEIFQEGFTENDDLQWNGKLGKNWLSHFKNFSKNLTLSSKETLEEEEFYWNIAHEGKTGYPVNEEGALQFTQELQQAIFEATETEAPLLITVLRIDKQEHQEINFEASFKNRTFHKNFGKESSSKKWEELNSFLKDIFSGEFRPDQALQKTPKKTGLYINLGDGLWYELGKSYLIQPSKVKQYLD